MQAVLDELQIWQKSGAKPVLWFRDDDFVKRTDASDQLFSWAQQDTIPLSLAVIPKYCDPMVLSYVEAVPGLSILQHGYDHLNYAGEGQKKCELTYRPDVVKNLDQGWKLLNDIFGDLVKPVLVPPWNRVDQRVVKDLAESHYKYFSCFEGKSYSGDVFRNCHIDLIDWPNQKRFIGVRAFYDLFNRELVKRRELNCMNKAIGILLHHQVHDQDLWKFLEDFSRYFIKSEKVKIQTATDFY